MRKKIVNYLLFVLMASVALPYSLIANTTNPSVDPVDPRLVVKWNRLSHNWLTLKTPSQVEHELTRMNFNCNPSFEKQDKKYMQFLALQSAELPLIKIKDDKYEIYDVNSPLTKITVQILGQNKFSLNGKSFEYDTKASLESNLEKIKPLLEGKKISLLDLLFIPNAHASIRGAATGVFIGIAALMVFAVIYNYRADKAEKGIAPSRHGNPVEFQDF